jgi:hypothetical protein
MQALRPRRMKGDDAATQLPVVRVSVWTGRPQDLPPRVHFTATRGPNLMQAQAALTSLPLGNWGTAFIACGPARPVRSKPGHWQVPQCRLQPLRGRGVQ